MKFSELIEHAIECVKTFNPIVKTLDSHADEFIKNVSIISILIHFSSKILTKKYSSNKFFTDVFATKTF
jgi:hypothetical protein